MKSQDKKEPTFTEREIALPERIEALTEKDTLLAKDEIFAERKEVPLTNLYEKESEHIQHSPKKPQQPKPLYSAVAAGKAKLEKNSMFKPTPPPHPRPKQAPNKQRSCFSFLI
jgi:hypothetical protein